MTNPDPGHIPDSLWWLWGAAESFIPGVRLGGIYAPKPHYHNTVNANKKSWPDSYSIQLPLDLTGPGSLARAIDLTMDTTQMVLRTRYLMESALDPDDNRLEHLREFYGTLDGVTVYGLIKDTEGGPWRLSTSDSSHLWHIHESFFTAFCASLDAAKANASVLQGQTWAEWQEGDDMLKAIMTNDSATGDTIFIIPSAGGWRRLPKSDNPWVLQNAVDAFTLAGMGVDSTTWGQSHYDFTDPQTIGQWGAELVPCFGGGEPGPPVLVAHEHATPAGKTGPASPTS